ncbi:peptidyl-prolyl cis-trans isomerase [Gluconobacter wancherniae]|uniref:peptidyl-prolyl cis-trans isomerase n=1 Tax=Gluconobacter wancherniae TaxID=1307955 RepID=UPI001B8A9CBA|nr:peptidyl-prolyl cis-trans isomerase [Gluconobacter wancherniae]MBS1093921.1 SurA N-terminal domain-containing protein [Gluconobacter wancherniae]
MITTLRHLLVDSWAGRAAALLIFLAFIGWGVGDVYSNMGTSGSNAIMKVGDRSITPDDLSRGLNAQLPQVAQQMGLADASHLPQAAREQAARQVLQNLITQNEVQAAAARAGMDVPDDVVRQEIFAIPFFHNAAGQFDRSILNERLTRIGMTEANLIRMMREDIITRAVLQGMGQSVQIPTSLTERLLSFDARQRVLDVLFIPLPTAPLVTTPTDAQLHRFYDNHPWDFRTPEYRHAKMVLLTQETVARSIEVPDDVLKRLYEAQERIYNVPETRTLQVITFADEARADSAAVTWRKGLPWTDLQKQYSDAASVSLPDARESDIPNPELAKAAFSAPLNQVTGPVKTSVGWVVFEITTIKAPHTTSFDAAKADMTAQVQKQEAPQAVQARMKQFQDAVAGSTTLDRIPADLGAAPVAGTMDAQGMTKDGMPAPIPGNEALRKAVVARVFSQNKGAQPSVVNGPDGSAFAILVDDVQPGTLKPFESVRAQVVQKWTAEQNRRIANERITTLFTAAKSTTLAKAVAGQPEEGGMRRNVTLSRIHPDQSLPEAVTRAAFGNAIGKTAMLETPEGYWLVNVTSEKAPDPKDIHQLTSQLQSQYLQSLQSDIPVALNAAFEKEVPPTHINMSLFNQVVAATGAQQ